MSTPEDAIAAYSILFFILIMAAVCLVVAVIAVVSEVRFRTKTRRYQYTKK